MSCSSNNYQWTKNIVKILITQLEKHSCLYSVTSKDYKNKSKRKSAMWSIQNNLKEHGVTITEADLKKKIHGLRTQYLAELRKIKRSKSSGAGADEVYVPTLWCYELLYFFQEDSYPERESATNFEFHKYNEEEEAESIDTGEDESVIYDGTLEDFNIHNYTLADTPTSSLKIEMGCQGRSSPQQMPAPRSGRGQGKRKRPNEEDDDGIQQLIKNATHTLTTARDRIDAGINWSNDPIDNFCRMLGDELKLVKNCKRLQTTKRKILSTVYDAQAEESEED
ncbi:uncharacterized protein LOC126881503 [Diabrotica virgifera virgifera]|uniref:Uncharacterized protein LOC114337678 n=1 Tax=Diabrotica virgifera virgifera TaxID=50390 RepID=A0A6P7GJN5_DIAVI|nr:uncharacterized protein LOC126881503 [Diabrotica virgifera virgifera]